MKKLMIALSMAALFSGSALASGDSLEIQDVSELEQNAVTQSNLKFYGEVAQRTCSIKQESQEQLVSLPKVLLEDLNNNKSGTGNTSFNIKLENCTPFPNQMVTILFKPDSNNLEGKYLKNTAGGQKAENVLIKLMQENREIDLSVSSNDQQNIQAKPLSEYQSGDYNFEFTAQYMVKSDSEATAGLVQATLPFEVSYK